MATAPDDPAPAAAPPAEPRMAIDEAAGGPRQCFDQYAVNSPGWTAKEEDKDSGAVTRAGDEV